MRVRWRVSQRACVCERCFIGRNDNGYAPFHFDMTDFLTYGGEELHLSLRVDASFGDGWFYEGAGIYRHVWLTKTDAAAPGQVGKLCAGRRERQCRDADACDRRAERGTTSPNVPSHVADCRCGREDGGDSGVAGAVGRAQMAARHVHGDSATLANPALWSPETPNLYSADRDGGIGGQDARCGARHLRRAHSRSSTPDKGFFLNGKPVKIQGHLQPPGPCRRWRGAA